ncbi:MAG TPA: tetratricopeptide repeat protein [Terriglobales bacterium]|nr:tetratricopeptide repeat protein [Terriglobales bacterium]
MPSHSPVIAAPKGMASSSMDNKGRNHPDDDFPTLVGGTAAVSSGSSSSGSLTPPDSPTIFDAGPTSDAPTMHEGTPAPGSGGEFPSDENFFKNGMVLAGRYEILDILGEGGMGAVYKAKDKELNRTVALKVIRPELARNTAIVDRFKQELRLSHQVTHKNVIRIYDLGEGEGVKFITMEFIDGKDLRSIIREKQKFSPEEAVEVMRQVCQALDAAHSVGVIHRDLKPQNIIRDTNGRVLVMDFGLARTIGGDGMTMSGALVGTMEYMSPEQALGKELDQRSDLFALGLIFYELLTGKMPFHAESAIASLLRRTQERAIPVSQHDASIPPALSDIVTKCLERDQAVRYQNVSEVLEDLEVWQGKRAAATIRIETSDKPWGQTIKWQWLGGIAVALVLAVTGFVLRKTLFSPAPVVAPIGPAISLAIMPFHNSSGDPKLDWLGSSLSDMLSTDVGQSAQVRMVSADRLHQVLRDLQISSQSQVDVATLKRLADFTNADTVVYGQYVKAGEQIRIDATVLDLRNDRSTVIKQDVASEKELLTGVDALAKSVREKLASNPQVLKDLEAHALRPSTNSVQALREYDNGIQLARAGNNLDAQKQLEAATTDDPNFALAYSKLAQIYSALGYSDQAESASRKAVGFSDSLPAPEKYLIEANHARIMNDTTKAIAAYETLAKVNPGDMDTQLTLAGLYEQAGNFDAARKLLATVVSNDPNNADALLASGRVEIKASNPQEGLNFLSRASSLAIQLGNQQQDANIKQAMGIAYGMLNKPDEALRNYQASLEIKQKIGDKRGAAASLEQIASIQDATGKPDAALASYKQALKIRTEIGDKDGIGNTLIDMGSFYHDHGKGDDALKNFKQALGIETELQNQPNIALTKHNIGVNSIDKGDYQDGLTYLQQAYEIRQKLNVPEDTAETLHNLAEANAKLGQYDEALAQYLKAIELRRGMNDQRGVAIESESMALIFAAQGRYAAALASMRDALKIFQDIKERTAFTVEIMSGLGGILAEAGRGDEGQKNIEDGLAIAQEIKNDAIASLALNWLGDVYFYKGDYAGAGQQYQRAMQTATKAANRERILLSKIDQAKVDVKQGKSQAAISALTKLSQDADTLGLKALSVEASVYMGEAMVQKKDAKGAQVELGRALARAEKLGLRVVQAKAHYWTAVALVQSNNGKLATPHFREVVRILEAISKEEGSAKILERADLQPIYRESMKGFQGN